MGRNVIGMIGHKSVSATKFRFYFDKRFGIGIMWRGWYLSIARSSLTMSVGKANLTGNKE